MAASKASSIHFGKDDQGYYFGYVDEATGTWKSVNLNRNQIALLGQQVFTELFGTKLGSEACDE